ncbi:MAG: hypothetical protein Kow0098_16950 [Ignavibacteriaceae bacterium]
MKNAKYNGSRGWVIFFVSSSGDVMTKSFYLEIPFSMINIVLNSLKDDQVSLFHKLKFIKYTQLLKARKDFISLVDKVQNIV